MFSLHVPHRNFPYFTDSIRPLYGLPHSSQLSDVKADSTAPENSVRTERGLAYERQGLCCLWYAPVLLSDSLLLLDMMFLRLSYSTIYRCSPRLAIYGPNQLTFPIILAFSAVILVE